MLSERLLVSTKFAPPRLRPQLVRRNRLLRQMQGDKAHRLTTITAGAGFGKTTLLAQWRQHLIVEGANVAWLSLSQHDAEFMRFCAYLAGAFQNAGVSIEDDLILLAADCTEDAVEDVSALLINAVSDYSSQIHLLIDDYHHVLDPLSYKLTQTVIDHGPENLRITIASRDPVPVNLSRFRVLGQLVEIDSIGLPFDFQETVEFFDDKFGRVLDPYELHMIYDSCAGWPAGLQLMAHGVSTRALDKSSISTLVQKTRNVNDYIEENVLPHMSTEMVRFSENLSICNRFTLDLAEHLTSAPVPDDVITDIKRNEFFITPIDLDDGHNWFRLHPLFSDFMHERLARRGADESRELHRKASEWFAERGFIIDAIHHARLADRFDFVVDFVERSSVNLPELSHLGSVRDLLAHLDPRELTPHVNLLLLGSWVFVLAGQPARAEKWIEQIHRTEAVNKPEISIQLRFITAALRVYHDDTSAALHLVEPLGDEVAHDRLLRQVRVIHLTTGYAAEGRYDEAYRIFGLAAKWPREEVSDDLALIAEGLVASVCLLSGDVQEAERRGQAVLERAEAAHGRRSVSAAVCSAFLADALYELDRLDAAQEVLANRLDMLRFTNPEPMIRATIICAKLTKIHKGRRAALAFLDEEENRFRKRGTDRALAYTLAEKAMLDIGRRDLGAANDLQEVLDRLGEKHSGSTGFLSEIPIIADLARSRLALAEQKPDEALNLLEAVSNQCNRLKRNRMLVTTNLLKGLAYHEMNRTTESDRHLAEAIQSGFDSGLTRTILDEGHKVLNLLCRHFEYAILDHDVTGYMQSLFEKATVEAPRQEAPEKPPAGGDQGDDETGLLTPREREIVVFLTQSMSNKRIARTLNISPQTVKWNLKNIFSKLGMHNRYEVIVWARNHRISGDEREQAPHSKNG